MTRKYTEWNCCIKPLVSVQRITQFYDLFEYKYIYFRCWNYIVNLITDTHFDTCFIYKSHIPYKPVLTSTHLVYLLRKSNASILWLNQQHDSTPHVTVHETAWLGEYAGHATLPKITISSIMDEKTWDFIIGDSRQLPRSWADNLRNISLW